MPTLNWIGKQAVVKHHKDVPFRLLEPVPELSCGGADSGNLIVQGDNLHALKALLPRYAGPAAFSLREEHAITFELGRYGYDVPYAGLLPLKRHFFPMIGNLKGIGEEFNCAEYIANQLEGVDWWVRNVEKKPHSFWLQTASDKFYPDFVIRMQNGLTLVVEYKGGHIAENRDSKEKKQIGELWAKRSDGNYRCNGT